MTTTQRLPVPARLDVYGVRGQFPSLSRSAGREPTIYFDGPAGTQMPWCVMDAMRDYLLSSNANVGSAYRTSVETDRVVLESRKAVADLLNCNPSEVVFGANMTTLTLAVSRAMARYLSAGDEVLVTALDHDANVSAWLALKERGVNVRVVNVNVGNCTLDMEDFEKKLTTKTRLVAVGLAANSVGTINDLGKITQLARGVRALVFVDAVHYVPHDIVDVRALDCDFLICSAYKFFGPHVGVLYGKKDRLQEIRPYRLQASSATVPEAWETGTQNHEGLAGLSACIDYLAGIGRRSSPSEKNRRGALRAAFQCISEHERTLSERLVVGLRDLLGIRTYGLWDPSELSRRTPTFAFRCKDREPRELARKLGEKGIFVGDGNFYAIHLARKLSIDNCGGLVRVGLVHYNTIDEVDRFLREVSRLA